MKSQIKKVHLSGEWKQDQLLNTSEKNVKIVFINHSSRKNLIKEISGVRLDTIELLNLSFNKIQSIEGINRICFPKLAKLYLDQNNISNIQTLRKIHCTHLVVLWLNNNIFLNLNEISELKAKWIQIISIKGIKKISMNFVLRIESNHINHLYYDQEIHQTRKVLGKKYQKLSNL